VPPRLTRTTPRYLLPLQALSATVLLTALGVSLIGIPARLEELGRVSPGHDLHVPVGAIAWGTLVSEVGMAMVFFTCAAVLLLRKPDSPMALFLAMTLAAIGAVETGMSDALISPQQLASIPALRAPVWGLRALEMAGALVLLYIFPDGRFTPRWTRWLAMVWITYIALCALVPPVPFNPLDGPTWRATPIASFIFGVGWFATGVYAQGYRLQHSRDVEERQQLKWTAVGLAMAVMGMMVYYGALVWGQSPGWPQPFPNDAGLTFYVLMRPAILTLSLAIFPICLSIAVLRYQLFDIDLVINRALVWGGLTAITMALYVVIVSALSLLFRTAGSPAAFFLATGVVAVLFQPLRESLQRGVNRLMYGERDDPYAVLSRLSQRLGGALAPDAIAPAIVESIGAALKLPYIALHVAAKVAAADQQAESDDSSRPGELLAAWGRPPPYAPLRLPLVHQGQPVGELILAPRGPGESFSVLDRRLLDDLAKQAGVALYATQQTRQAQQLAVDLQHSRERLVAAREEERRRLRRDLHDGLGPALASMTLKVDAARDELNYDAGSATTMLGELKSDIQAAVADIRRLVYDLRPPALDDLGLATSLCLLAERYQNTELTITCDLPERLPALPAAVEVAVYRITAEALTNVVRHAGARACRVRLAVAQRVDLEISDDGRGVPAEAVAGVGLISMRERAAELGGGCTVTSTPGRGTTIHVWLPLPG
jgi:signal transduction histidine kinase